MHDDRVVGGTLLDREEAGHRGRVQRVGGETVDGFGGQDDQFSGSQPSGGLPHGFGLEGQRVRAEHLGRDRFLHVRGGAGRCGLPAPAV